MKKIPTIFKRNPENLKEILHDHNDGCEWVFNGEGVATRKYDGTCCRVLDGELWKRRELKKHKVRPKNFVIADFDVVTGKTVGWVLVSPENKEDKWHVEAFKDKSLSDGTYELCGAKVQGNPEKYESHTLISHDSAIEYDLLDRSYDGIRDFMKDMDIEGIVFHHEDGRMAKIKKRDYGLKRC